MSRRHDRPPYDERGLPADAVARCPSCRAWYPKDGWHRCADNKIGDPPEE